MTPAALPSLAASLLRAGLPALSTVVGAVVPPPYDILSGLALSAIRLALGLPAGAGPDEVAARVDADGDAARARLGPVEEAHADAAEAIRLALADTADARATTVRLAEAGSPAQWGAPVVSAVATLGFALVAVLVMLGRAGDGAAAQLVLGAMISGYSTVLAYWLGSSKGSADRADQIAAFLRGALPPPRPARGRP